LTTNYLNIASICPKTKELGPGKRFALWVQGCPFQCKGCLAPDWIPLRQAQLRSIETLAEQILAADVDGLSISGGEPFLQASKLSALVELIWQKKPEMTVIVFTGFTLLQLDWEEAIHFLKYIDVLKTGLYVDKWNDDKGLRGSSNQQFHFLTNRLEMYADYFNHKERTVEIHVEKDSFLMVGVPPKQLKY
jgi:anaerobic ribonucleoside-triphosphate reductase activating protein